MAKEMNGFTESYALLEAEYQGLVELVRAIVIQNGGYLEVDRPLVLEDGDLTFWMDEENDKFCLKVTKAKPNDPSVYIDRISDNWIN